jgi:hypothetical protein
VVSDTTERPSVKAVRQLLHRVKEERDRYWVTHRGDWDRQEERNCPLCGGIKSGYPFVWWHVPASEEIRSIKGIGEIPDLACIDCYGSFRVQTELWGKTSEEVVRQLLKDRNWRLWLDRLPRTGYQDCAPVGGDEGRWALVVQLYARDWRPEDQPPANTFNPTPNYLVVIPDAESDPLEFGEVSVYSVLRGHAFAHLVRGQDELREFLHLGPEAWRAQQDEGLLRVEQAAERLGISAKTAYEYCSNFFAYGEYGLTHQSPEDLEASELSPKKKTSIRKLYHQRTTQGDIRIPPWAVDLFLMQYEKGQDIHTLTTTRNEVRLLMGDQESYRTWRGDKGEERIAWLPRFEFQSTEGGRRTRWSRVLTGITEIPRPGAPWREWSREYLDARPCPPQESWLIEDIKREGGAVTYGPSPDEYWNVRSRMEYERLLYQQESEAEQEQD